MLDNLRSSESPPSLEEIVEATAMEAIQSGKAIFPIELDQWTSYTADVDRILKEAKKARRVESTSTHFHRKFAQGVLDLLRRNRKFGNSLVVNQLEDRDEIGGAISRGLIIYRRDQIPPRDLTKLRKLYRRQLPEKSFIF